MKVLAIVLCIRLSLSVPTILAQLLYPLKNYKEDDKRVLSLTEENCKLPQGSIGFMRYSTELNLKIYFNRFENVDKNGKPVTRKHTEIFTAIFFSTPYQTFNVNGDFDRINTNPEEITIYFHGIRFTFLTSDLSYTVMKCVSPIEMGIRNIFSNLSVYMSVRDAMGRWNADDYLRQEGYHFFYIGSFDEKSKKHTIGSKNFESYAEFMKISCRFYLILIYSYNSFEGKTMVQLYGLKRKPFTENWLHEIQVLFGDRSRAATDTITESSRETIVLSQFEFFCQQIYIYEEITPQLISTNSEDPGWEIYRITDASQIDLKKVFQGTEGYNCLGTNNPAPAAKPAAAKNQTKN